MKLSHRSKVVALLVILAAIAMPRIGIAASVRLRGNTPDADSLALLGTTTAFAPTASLSMRAVIALRNQAGLKQLLSDLQNPDSPNYHHWLAPGEFTALFGPTPDQVAQVSTWLSSQGFTVTSASADDRAVRFTGSAALASSVFQVRFAASADGTHFANLDSPAIPASLVSVIQSIRGLNNLHGFRYAPQPEVKVGASKHAFGPPDLYAFYDETPLLNNGIDGSGADCIALPEYSDFDEASVDAFDSAFSLPTPSITTISVDGSGSSDSGAAIETLIDIEYSHTAAPQAPIRVYVAGLADANDPVSGFLDTLQQAVNDDVCGSISLSIGVCPSEDASVANDADAFYTTAFMQHQTVFVAAGDDGTAAEIVGAKGCVAGKQRGVNEIAASPNVTSVGGTQAKVKFVKSTGIVIPGSAPETVWHESAGASGGGASQVFTTKPSYQNGVTPSDGVRDIPDISLLAATKTPGYVYGQKGALFCCLGGTSFASPYWAGIAALMEQMNGGGMDGRLGPINTQLYSLASTNAAGNGIRDVTKGNNGFNGVKGYTAAKGYDQATGWGTPDISAFVHAYTGK